MEKVSVERQHAASSWVNACICEEKTCLLWLLLPFINVGTSKTHER
jgi:hypothetical protein